MDDETMSQSDDMLRGTGQIGHLGTLDLLGMTSLKNLAGTEIGHVGQVLVPELLLPQLWRLRIGAMGEIVRVPGGEHARVRRGNIQMSGDDLETGTGNPEDVLVVVGQLVLTSSARRIGYKGLVVTGQVIAPAASRSVLDAALTHLSGQVAYFREPARQFIGEYHLTQGLFELLDGPLSLVLVGEFTVDNDVSVELLRSKVREIVLAGTLQAPKRIVPVLQLLTTINLGAITVEDNA